MKRKTRRSPKQMIKIPAPQDFVKPGDNFYKYVNGNWLHNATIPTYRVSFGVSEEIELLIEKQLFSILYSSYDFSEKGKTPQTDRERFMDAIGRFAMSSLRKEKQQKSVDLLKRSLRPFYCIRDQEDISTHLGFLNAFGIPTLLELGIFKRKAPHSGFYISIGPGKLGLPDLTYYNATAPGKTRTLFSYVRLCRELSKLLGIDDITPAIQVESRLSPVIQKYRNDDFEDIEGVVLEKQFPGISWDLLFASYGVENWKEKPIRVKSMRWLRSLETYVTKWPKEDWSNLFTLHMILHAIPILPPPYDTLHFELFGKLLRGQADKLPQDQLTLNLCKDLLRIPLSRLYIEDYIEPNVKEEITAFTNKIRNYAVKHIMDLDWLEETTKLTAKEKLQKMKLSISHPATFPPLQLPDLQTDNFLQNVYLLAHMNTNLVIRRLKVGTDSWDEPPYAVNAYYFNETNQFILPAGSIQFPFYKKGSLGWSFGGLGAVIGHEMTHAFDMEGKEYDTKGEKTSWWTKKDNAAYSRLTRMLVNLYNKGKILDHAVDGDLTLSENISDLGGLGIALDALNHEIEGLSEVEKKRELRDFFMSYAVSWRIKDKPRKQLQRLFMDVHAPAELRVNYIVSQFQEWYDLFGVVTGDTLYIPAEERVRIF
jgi:putative endopeptidase